jgi:D-alanyl-D-alanine carboxypeptidase
VRSLSGIVSTRSGRELYYSIIVNDFSRDTDDVVEFIDRLAVTLAGS